MKRLLLMVMASLLLMPALAGARDMRPGFGARLQAQGQPMKKDPGEFRRDDKRKEQGKRHQGRLTEEERRELHRDLNRANREIYRR